MSSKPGPIGAREVYQALKDTALGLRRVRGLQPGSWHAVSSGAVIVSLDGYQITLIKEAGVMDYCAACKTDDGRTADAYSWPGAGTDPLQLLSVWECAQLERALVGD